jgi:hypothetical protein
MKGNGRMKKTSTFTRRWTTVIAGTALVAGTGLFLAPSASVAASALHLTLAPAHRVTGQPPNASHGGGGGGGGGSLGWASSNWSGYAVQTTSAAPFTAVTGSWKVPTVQRPRRASYGFSAAWVGIDGFFNSPNALIQTGTEQDWYNGSGHYNAWWTSSAQGYAEQTITSGCGGSGANCGTVIPGDMMTASITLSGSITLTDSSLGHGWSYNIGIGYSGPGLSAEWIMEAPSTSTGVLPMANYGSTVFDPGAVNGRTPGLVIKDGGDLVQGGVVSIPSGPDGDADGFAVSYGSSAPAPPGS